MSWAHIRAYRNGIMAEMQAAWLYCLKGHRIVAKRCCSPVGEIDLVATKANDLSSWR